MADPSYNDFNNFCLTFSIHLFINFCVTIFYVNLLLQ